MNRRLAGLLLVVFALWMPTVQVFAVQSVPTSLNIRRVQSSPAAISFNYPASSFQRDYLIDVSGSLEISTSNSLTFQQSTVNGLVFILTIYLHDRIVGMTKSQVTVFESPYSIYWEAKFWVTAPVPDAYSGFNLVASFVGTETFAPSTSQSSIFLDIDKLQVTDFPILSMDAALRPLSTQIRVLTVADIPYGSMFYVSLGGTFTANYSAPCLNAPRPQWCGSASMPSLALPIGLTIHLTVTDGKQIVQSIDIVTDGGTGWTTQFWLSRSVANYYLIGVFQGIRGRFAPTLTQAPLLL